MYKVLRGSTIERVAYRLAHLPSLLRDTQCLCVCVCVCVCVRRPPATLDHTIMHAFSPLQYTNYQKSDPAPDNTSPRPTFLLGTRL